MQLINDKQADSLHVLALLPTPRQHVPLLRCTNDNVTLHRTPRNTATTVSKNARLSRPENSITENIRVGICVSCSTRSKQCSTERCFYSLPRVALITGVTRTLLKLQICPTVFWCFKPCVHNTDLIIQVAQLWQRDHATHALLRFIKLLKLHFSASHYRTLKVT